MRWLVTGASGFVGRALVTRLLEDPANAVRAVVRRAVEPRPGGPDCAVVPDLGPDTLWQGALGAVDVVVHLAARVHVMRESARDPLAEFRRVNVQGTLNLARQAAEAGVRRFVFISSVKVNGESTAPGVPFRADDPPQPQDAYGQSKREAEEGLRRLTGGGMECVIVRPPLVYGPGVQANFRTLMQFVARGWPLPLGAVHNRRSFVALDNLVDLIIVCARHPAAAGQTFLASDGHDLSTAELLRGIAQAMGRQAHLWPVPIGLLQWGARVAGRGAMAQRLCGNLQMDISKTRELLAWVPPIGVEEGLRRAASGVCRVDET